MIIKSHFSLLLILFFLASCSSEDPDMPIDPGLVKGTSFFVLNEGAFGQGNASICLMDGAVESNCSIYEDVNKMPIGDVLQSGVIIKDHLYLVVNGSGRIVRLDLPELAINATLDQIASPRSLLPISAEKAYVSDIYGNVIHIVSLSDLSITGSIPFPGWSENMIKFGDQVWVTNPELFGGPQRNQIFIIDSNTDQIIDSVMTGRNPVDIEYNSDGEVWVLSSGNPIDMDSAQLVRIDPGTRTILARWKLPPAFSGKIALSSDNMHLAIMLDSIYLLDISNGDLELHNELSELIMVPYALGFSPGNSDQLWVSDARDFSSAGMVILWDLNEGVELDRRSSGINPNGFIFY